MIEVWFLVLCFGVDSGCSPVSIPQSNQMQCEINATNYSRKMKSSLIMSTGCIVGGLPK